MDCDNRMNIIEYRIALLGDAAVGKTSFLTKLKTGKFQKSYVATSGVCVTIIEFPSTNGIRRFIITDFAGTEKYVRCYDDWIFHSDACIVMFDFIHGISFKSVKSYIKRIREIRGKDHPIVLCGNKYDALESKVNTSEKNYIETSVNLNHNLTQPFLKILRLLECDEKLDFVENWAIKDIQNENGRSALMYVAYDSPNSKIQSDHYLRWFHAKIRNLFKLICHFQSDNNLNCNSLKFKKCGESWYWQQIF